MIARGAQPAPATDLRLIELAADYVRRHGATRLTITDIAAEAGMSHANVYRYFGSKAALRDAIIMAWLAPLEAGLRVIADAPDPAYDKLERLLFAVHRAYREKLAGDPHIFELFCKATETQTEITRRHRQRVARALHRILDEGQNIGTFQISDQGTAVLFVLDAMHRFLSPLAIRADIDLEHGAIENRATRLVQFIARALSSGAV